MHCQQWYLTCIWRLVVQTGVRNLIRAKIVLIHPPGGIAHPGAYTSYDYVSLSKYSWVNSEVKDCIQGAAISESRVLREKYHEIKLQANFLAVSPAYLTSQPQNIYNTSGSFTGNPALKTTQTVDVVGGMTGFYIVRCILPRGPRLRSWLNEAGR